MVSRRVVITGIGAITPIGSGAEGLWQGVRCGEPAGRRITRFDPAGLRSQVAAEIPHFDPTEYVSAKRARRLDHFSQLSVAASAQALADAGLAGGSPELRRGAVYLGSALGGVPPSEEEHSRFLTGGLRAVSPMLALSVFGGAGATNVAIEFGMQGPAMGNANSCASGSNAIGEAFRLVRSGSADIALAGGVEAPIAPLTIGAFALIRATTTRNEDPRGASRPFDQDRDGFLMAEGGAMLLLEDLGHAERRGARPYAELNGYGATNDAHHMTAPLPTGEAAALAMTLAMHEAGRGPDEIGYINAHATATPLGDPAEARAVRRALGVAADRIPVSGTKGLHGHSLGASGAIEAAITALSLDRGWLPPTANLEALDPACELAHVPAGGKEEAADVAVTNSFGFGGFNASLVLSRWQEA
jgi:3-oxoacyl-[acyl-carrier-protein] synthase II